MLFLFFFLLPVINAQQRACGTMQSFFSTDSRIVGGETAANYAWPWQVYIALRGSFTCGGTLIDARHVLTAAHCVVGQSNDANDYLVRVGAHTMSQGYYSGTTYPVSDVYAHGNYVSAENGYDVAILRLSYEVTGSDTVNIICLPPSSNFYIPMYQPVVITGFGLTSEGGSLPYTLQQAIIQLLPTCSNVYGGYDSNTQICAGIQGGGRDTCQGDSGGPLVYQPRRSSQWYIIGITSYGNGCARDGYPGIYTRVSAYLGWIQQIIGQK
jgi:secreted trypsin-like serine protease